MKGLVKTIKMGRKKMLPKTEKQKKALKIVVERHKRDMDPHDTRSDTMILKQTGYAPTTKVCEVLKSKMYLEAHEVYYKNRKTPEQLQAQLAAKARRNLYEGMDNIDPKIKLEYTKMQLNQEDKEASRQKLEMTDVHGNMITLLGSAATEAIESTKIVSNIVEIEELKEKGKLIE